MRCSPYFQLSLALLVSACNLKPTYTRPVMEMSDTWRFTPENTQEYANLLWWEQFEDPVLNNLIQVALDNNQDLHVATARVLEYFALYRIAMSKFFPQLGVSTGVDRLKLSREVDFQPPVPGVPLVNNMYNFFGKLLPYEVDFWGSIRNATASAKANYFAQVEAKRTVILTLVSSLAQSYIELRELDNQLLISQLTYESRLKSLEIATRRYEAGLTSEMEVKQAQSQADDAQVQIKNFEQLIAQQEDLISLLIGAAPGPITRGNLLSNLKLPPSIPVGLPSDLIKNRPDILQAEQQMISANAEIGVARASFFPQINLTGLDGQRSTDFSKFFASSANLFDGAIDLIQPIFTGGRLTNQLLRSQAIYRETLHTYFQTILKALQEVENSLISHQKAKERLEIHTKEVEVLEQYLKLSRLRYENGQNDYLTVVNAETRLFHVQLEMTANQADVFLSLVSLYKSLGQGWDVPQAAENPGGAP